MLLREILQQVARQKTYLDNGGKPGDEADTVHFGGVKRRSILFDLYFIHIPLNLQYGLYVPEASEFQS
jgi:hypothetical protein